MRRRPDKQIKDSSEIGIFIYIHLFLAWNAFAKTSDDLIGQLICYFLSFVTLSNILELRLYCPDSISDLLKKIKLLVFAFNQLPQARQ